MTYMLKWPLNQHHLIGKFWSPTIWRLSAHVIQNVDDAMLEISIVLENKE